MANFSKVVIYKAHRADPARAAKAARVIRSIKGRYRAQAFLFLAYHFFLSSPLHLDVFVIFFILVSNFMNRKEAFPIQMLIEGVRFLLDERRFIMRTTQVFGATGHIGRSLVRAILAHGDQCTAVGWTHQNTPEQMQEWQDRCCLGLLCDVRVRETVDYVLKKSLEHWGKTDVIVNSTGYGVIGACEDQDDYDLRNQFSTNFLGTLHIIQLSLPYFRQQSAGRYLIFSSTAGSLGVPGLGPYCATKYAVEGLIESMLYEIDAFNIKATLVEPGHVRLDEPDDNIVPSGYPITPGAGPPKPKRYGHFSVKPNPSEPYATLTSPAQHARRMVQWLNDRQPVSAVKSAELVWQLGHYSIRDRLRSITEEIEDWKHLSFPVTATDDDATSEKGRASEKGDDDMDEDNE
ncbi:hypothetical protein E8E11_010208 [Didymella keratinophila]|nr:hypothetical protein E8E11_010208 [Didymella keratinophila]